MPRATSAVDFPFARILPTVQLASAVQFEAQVARVSPPLKIAWLTVKEIRFCASIAIGDPWDGESQPPPRIEEMFALVQLAGAVQLLAQVAYCKKDELPVDAVS